MARAAAVSSLVIIGHCTVYFKSGRMEGYSCLAENGHGIARTTFTNDKNSRYRPWPHVRGFQVR